MVGLKAHTTRTEWRDAFIAAFWCVNLSPANSVIVTFHSCAGLPPTVSGRIFMHVYARLCVIREWEDVCFLSVKSSLLISCGDVWNLSAQTFSLALKQIFTTKIFNLPATVFPQLVDNLHSSRISPCTIYFLLSASYWPIFQHLSIGSHHEWVWHDLCCELN